MEYMRTSIRQKIRLFYNRRRSAKNAVNIEEKYLSKFERYEHHSTKEEEDTKIQYYDKLQNREKVKHSREKRYSKEHYHFDY